MILYSGNDFVHFTCSKHLFDFTLGLTVAPGVRH